MSSNNQQQHEQKRPRISMHNAPFAQIMVGPFKRCFTVHLDLLAYHSPFFRAALTGSFKEASEKLVTLYDTEYSTFELFVHWLYYQRLPTVADSSELLASYMDETNPSIQCRSLVMLYIFGNKYDVPQLRKHCLNAMFQHIMNQVGMPDVVYVGFAFENLEDTDPLCRMFIDTCCYWAREDDWTVKDVEQLPPAFLTKILNLYTRFTDEGRDTIDMPHVCDYHGHATDEEKADCEEMMEIHLKLEQMSTL